MSLISKLIKTGITVGAAYAAVKISEKYNAENPGGVKDPAQKVNAIKQAASEVFSEAAQVAEEKAPGVVKTVTETAQKAADLAKQVAPDAVTKVQEAAQTVTEKAKAFVDSLDSPAVDAEFTDLPDEEKAEPEKENDPDPLDPVDVERK